MKTFLPSAVLLIGGTCSVLSFGIMQDAQPGNPASNDSGLIERVLRLENRVRQLENILFSTSQLSQSEAERRLEYAQKTLDQSKKLFKKGYINDTQLVKRPVCC